MIRNNSDITNIVINQDKSLNEHLTVQSAGARGGNSTLIKYGKEYFREIGRKGQAALTVRISSEQRRAWGALGGRPKKRQYSFTGEKEKLVEGGWSPPDK